MNALKARKRYDEERAEEAWRKRHEEEEARVAAMSEEDRKAYEVQKAKRRNHMFQTLGMMTALTNNGPYSTQATKDLAKIISGE